MTEIKCEYNETEIEISMCGHAGYGPVGCDIVCSAVSILSTTLAQALINNTKHIKYKLEPGNVSIKVENTPETRLIVKTIMTGFELLQEEYKKNIKILGKNGTKNFLKSDSLNTDTPERRQNRHVGETTGGKNERHYFKS